MKSKSTPLLCPSVAVMRRRGEIPKTGVKQGVLGAKIPLKIRGIFVLSFFFYPSLFIIC